MIANNIAYLMRKSRIITTNLLDVFLGKQVAKFIHPSTKEPTDKQLQCIHETQHRIEDDIARIDHDYQSAINIGNAGETDWPARYCNTVLKLTDTCLDNLCRHSVNIEEPEIFAFKAKLFAYLYTNAFFKRFDYHIEKCISQPGKEDKFASLKVIARKDFKKRLKIPFLYMYGAEISDEMVNFMAEHTKNYLLLPNSFAITKKPWLCLGPLMFSNHACIQYNMAYDHKDDQCNDKNVFALAIKNIQAGDEVLANYPDIGSKDVCWCVDCLAEKRRQHKSKTS